MGITIWLMIEDDRGGREVGRWEMRDDLCCCCCCGYCGWGIIVVLVACDGGLYVDRVAGCNARVHVYRCVSVCAWDYVA